jgi:crotonobetaine/carnitine-CoA ligase
MNNVNALQDLRGLTLPSVLRSRATALPDKIFLTEIATGRVCTFRDYDLWSNRVANAFRAVGLAKGSHIGIFMGNSADHLAVFFGIGKLGGVSVPVNTAARGELLRYFLTQSDCEAVVVDASLVARLQEILPGAPKIRHVFFVRGADGNQADFSEAGISGSYASSELAAAVEAASDQIVDADVECSDLLMLAYTSGTTGPSKGCMLSHAAALTYGTGAAEAQGYSASDVFYVCLPLFHNNALLAATASALVVGGSVALSQRFSVSKFWSEIRASGATITNLLGAMTSFLWAMPPSADDRDNKLRLVSMAPPPKFAREFEHRFGLSVMSNYGLSDFGMATSFTGTDPREKIGSIGRPRRGMQVRIVDDNDFETPPGTPGEIVLRCDDPWRAASGYYKMPEATLTANRNQWFHTGDRGIMDADGYLWFVDRKKDCIRRRGENISAFEVEQILSNHPSVATAAVFPVATRSNDEEVAAVVVRRPGASIGPRELIEHCQRNMSYFMVPRFIEFREELPTTVNQKIEKFRLRQDLESDLGRAWDREAEGVALVR